MTTGQRRAASSGDDELLSRLYQQVTEREAARFAAGYDMAAGLDRYKAWLDEHAVGEQASSVAGTHEDWPAVTPAPSPAAKRAAAYKESAWTRTERLIATVYREVLTSGPPAAVARPLDVTAETSVAPMPVATVTLGAAADKAAAVAERAVKELYAANYRSLVRLAALLVRDLETAEDVVQDAFFALGRSGWPLLQSREKALAYLRQSVVNRSRSVLRHRLVVDRSIPEPPADMPSAEPGAIALFERSAVLAALRSLPARQREALVLRFYADMSEAQIAKVMQISRGAVKNHTARAMQALRAALERDA